MSKSEADYLKELIAFPSVSTDKETLNLCAGYLAGFFKSNGMYTRIIESGGYPNVIATSQKTKTPSILLQAHMDVVPADQAMFKLRQRGGKLIGRGTFDMKFACASYMKLLDELGEDIHKYDFGIILTFDEEIGGHNGVEAMLNQGYGAQICILPDSGKNWQLETTGNGAWFVKLSKVGKSAHGSLPHTGINAAEILNQATAEICELREQYDKHELALSLTRQNAGKAMNQIPGYAEATFDIRFRTDEIYKDIKTRLGKICAKYKVRMENIELFACMSVDVTKPEIVRFTSIAEEVLSHKITTSHSEGSTDARYFCAKGIPCVIIQPDGGGRHSDDEWIDHAGLKKFTQILSRYIKEYAII
ncbi:MAG TPA: M20 family metallopeptidase [Candidatus Saccharimonadales bacterium]|nr:M20 family metallopeptidase [Candidatus Saccharimonadales bacterium]